MRTIIINAVVVTMNHNREIFNPGYVDFENETILSAGPMDELEAGKVGKGERQSPPLAMGEQPLKNGVRLIDGKDKIVMPGMVNLHTHMGMIPFRGLGDDCKDRLRVFLLPMEQEAMDAELVYLSTSYAAGEMLLSGVTTVLDMYYFEEEAARAMDEMGIRGIAGQTIMDEGACDCQDSFKALDYSRALMEKYKGHPRISACAAPHGTSTCRKEVLVEAFQMNRAYGAPFTLHAAEMDYEMNYFKEKFHMSPVQYLDSINVLGPETLAAHCIHMSDRDLCLLKERGAGVAHCIGSNTKAAKGVAPISAMLDRRISVGLGTDGPASGNTLDLFTQMKLCANFHKNETKDRSAFPAESITGLATIYGAKALGLDGAIGSLETGKQADLVLLETSSANMFPVYDPYSVLVYSANASNVDTVFVAGECLVKEKRLVNKELSALRRGLEEKMRKTGFKEYMITKKPVL